MSLKQIVGQKIYTVWVEMLRQLVPDGRTHRLAPLVAGMLQYAANIAYEKYGDNYELPSQMEFTFTVDRMMFPRGMNGQSDTDDDSDKESDNTTGKVYITYANYKINQGLPDELFKTENNESK